MRVARLAAEQNTVVSRAQLRACGLTSDAITVRARRGTLHRVHRGVYSVVHPDALTMKARLTAAVLACGDGAVLSHWAAGAWWQLVAYDEGRPPEVTVPGDGGRKIDAIRAHRSRGLHRRDVWTRERIRITTPARTALDLAAGMPHQALRRMLRQAQAERRLGVGQLRDVHARARGHRGATALLAVIADGPTPTRSVAEDLLLDLLEDAGLPRPQVNPLLTLDGTRLMPDFLWRRHRLVVEVDGAQYHGSAQARREDARRQALLEAHGYRVLRVSYVQLTRHPEQTIARIGQALAFADAAAAG
jgi:very-short-patch-repair endonuclease